MSKAAITGMAAFVPEKVLTNADFEKFLDTSDEWITQRTGIKERHVVSDGQTTSTLAVAAAKKALAEANLTAEELDLIICATVSPDMPMPSTACFVQHALGAGDTPAFDIMAACSGFIYALTIGSQFIETGKYRKVLVIAGDSLTRLCDFEDRGSCILFGDAAGAAILEPADDSDKGVQYTVMHADGGGWDLIHVPAGGSKAPASAETVAQRQHYIKMKGRDVYKFAVDKMQWLLGECMEKCNLTADDIDMVIPHQVNSRIIDSATRKFNFPAEKVYMNIDRYGNTSGASVALALAEAREKGKVKAGDTVLLIAFGAGLTWAGAVVKL